MSFKVMGRRCDQCLMDANNRIVSARRAAELMRECKERDVPFLCHKATMAGKDIACRGHHDAAPSRNARFGDWLGLPHEEYDPDTLAVLGRSKAVGPLDSTDSGQASGMNAK